MKESIALQFLLVLLSNLSNWLRTNKLKYQCEENRTCHLNTKKTENRPQLQVQIRW